MTDDGCAIPRHAVLPLTQAVALDLSPDDWQHVASFLTGLLAREPLKSGANDPTGWRAEQWILGCLATELRLMAHEAGETAEPAPRTFGRDPLEKAREQIAVLAETHDADERDRQRRLGDGLARAARSGDLDEAEIARLRW